jgi:serine/threonine protein phosphatase 1
MVVRNGRTYVIGDIHGCLNELNALLDFLRPDSNDQVCFLGDYVDRGTDSKGVIARLIQLRDEGPRCTFLKGNHEAMLLAYLGHAGLYGDAFLLNGGGRTLASYGISAHPQSAAEVRLPREHEAFLVSLERDVRLGEFFCVHAGLHPGRPLEKQTDEDRFWIREGFITVPHRFPFTILFGHTPQRDVFLDLPYKIGLDTGLVYGNKLSCLELETKSLFQVRRETSEVITRDLEEEFARAAPLTSRGAFI